MRREENKHSGRLKWIGIGFVLLMFIAGIVVAIEDTVTGTQNAPTTTIVEESKQLGESLVEESEVQEEESLAEEKETEEKEEAERLEQESIEAEEKWQEALDNPRTDVTYDNLMRTLDDYFGEVVQYSGTVIQTITSDDIVQQRVALYDDYDQIVLIEYPSDLPEVRLLDDDYITFTGVSFGTITYETVLGSTLEIPSILVERVGLE